MSGIFMRFPGGRKKALTLSYDDGVEQDRRLMQIMDAHGLKGTFNLNSGEYAADGTVYPKDQIHRRMSEKEVTELYAGSGHEVAVHGLTHPFLEQLPGNVILQEVVKDRENLENQFHTVVRGMAYPFGTYNDQVVECLKMAGLPIPEPWNPAIISKFQQTGCACLPPATTTIRSLWSWQKNL